MGLNRHIYRAGALILIMLATLFMFAIPQPIKAQDAANSITLGISPQLLEITANPGEVFTNTFRLTNASSSSLAIRTVPKNFTPFGEEGSVSLTEEETTYSIAQWISVSPTTVTIPSSKTQDFEVTINVPSDAEPGSHFGSVVFKTIPPEDDAAVALVSQEIAPVILVKIAGDVTESADIEDFVSTKSFWSNEPTVDLVSRIKNNGNVHFKPTGQIVIKNMFGKEVETLELSKENVLPDSIRAIATQWEKKGLRVGRYTAELTIVIGEDNEISTMTTSFIIFPYQTILPAIVGALFVGLVLFKGRSRISLALRALSGKETNK